MTLSTASGRERTRKRNISSRYSRIQTHCMLWTLDIYTTHERRLFWSHRQVPDSLRKGELNFDSFPLHLALAWCSGGRRGREEHPLFAWFTALRVRSLACVNRVHPGNAPVRPDIIYLPFVTLVLSAGYGKNNIWETKSRKQTSCKRVLGTINTFIAALLENSSSFMFF